MSTTSSPRPPSTPRNTTPRHRTPRSNSGNSLAPGTPVSWKPPSTPQSARSSTSNTTTNNNNNNSNNNNNNNNNNSSSSGGRSTHAIEEYEDADLVRSLVGSLAPSSQAYTETAYERAMRVHNEHRQSRGRRLAAMRHHLGTPGAVAESPRGQNNGQNNNGHNNNGYNNSGHNNNGHNNNGYNNNGYHDNGYNNNGHSVGSGRGTHASSGNRTPRHGDRDAGGRSENALPFRLPGKGHHVRFVFERNGPKLLQHYEHQLHPLGLCQLLLRQAGGEHVVEEMGNRRMKEIDSHAAAPAAALDRLVEEKRTQLQRRLNKGRGAANGDAGAGGNRGNGRGTLGKSRPPPLQVSRSGDASPRAAGRMAETRHSPSTKRSVSSPMGSVAAATDPGDDSIGDDGDSDGADPGAKKRVQDRIATPRAGRRESIAGPLMEGNTFSQTGSVTNLVGDGRSMRAATDDHRWRTFVINQCGLLRSKKAKDHRRKRADLSSIRFIVERVRETINSAWPELETVSVTEWSGMVRISVRMSELSTELGFIAFMNTVANQDDVIRRYSLRPNPGLWATRVVSEDEERYSIATRRDGEGHKKAGRLVFTLMLPAVMEDPKAAKERAMKEMEALEAKMADGVLQHRKTILKNVIPGLGS